MPLTKEEDSSLKRLKLYEFLLSKYSELINENEKKTIGEIKGLIDADNLTIQSVLAEQLPEKYSFEENYLETAEKLFDYITSEIESVVSGVDLNFWLSPEEIFELKLADDEDFAVLLCSFLFALGDEKAFVVIAELENLTIHAFVITEHKNKFFLFDPCQKNSFKEFVGEKEIVLQKYSFDDSKIKRFLYKFNKEEYEQFLPVPE